MRLTPEAKLGRYRILSSLGGGGMGEVYKATDTRLARTVAIKVLRGGSGTAEDIERFEREAHLIGQLNHPHICTLHDIGNENGTPYLVMEYVDGVTLEARLRQGALPLDEAIEYSIQIAEGLNAAHRQGIVHRDLKPGNIMLTRSGVKLVDFGLAKFDQNRHGFVAAEDPTRHTLTEEGAILGTLQYMAPEQVEGKEVDARTDIFAFGVVVYEMLTGRKVFEGSSKASLIAAILRDSPPRVSTFQPTVSRGFENTISRCLAKDIDERWQSVGDLLFQLKSDAAVRQAEPVAASPRQDEATSAIRPRPRRGAFLLVAVGLLLLAGLWLNNLRRSTGLSPELLTQIEMHIEKSDWEGAYALARKSNFDSSTDPELTQLWSRFSSPISLDSTPPGARVFRRAYGGKEDDWIELGLTPIREVRIPYGLSRIRLTRDGYKPLLQTVLGGTRAGTRAEEVVLERQFTLDTDATLPPGMVRVPGWSETIGGETVKFADFLIAQHEVTNREFKEFVDAKGYERPELWQPPFFLNGRELSWKDAMQLLTDETGLPGPKTWIAGDYPNGQEDYPVSGVSWYEAAAFAKFSGKELPTIYHWQRAFSINAGSTDAAWVLPSSNLEGTGPAPAGKFDSLNWSGAYDMAGNVREWTLNAVGDQRFCVGGSWSDYRYIAITNRTNRLLPFDRSAINGFRVAVVRDDSGVLAKASLPLTPRETPDYSKVKPVADQTFDAYKSQYASEPGPLDPVPEPPRKFRNWTRERITLNAAYDGKRLVMYLYLPLNGSPPYQTVMFFPGADAWAIDSIDQYGMPVDFLIKSGRAVAFPVLRGTFERRDGSGPVGRASSSYSGPLTPTDTDAFVKVVQDVRRGLDYLVTRPDVAPESLSYYGHSTGAMLAPNILSQEPRFRAAVLSLAGLPINPAWPPELQPVTFLPRVKIPVLQFSGTLDTTYPLETSAKPFFKMLGTPDSDKELEVIPGGHIVLTSTQARRTIEFLNKRIGPTR